MSSCSATDSCECGTTTHFLTPEGENNLLMPESNSQEEPTIYPLDPEVLIAVSGDPIESGILDEEGQIVLIDNDIAARTGTTHFYIRIDPTEAKGSVVMNGVVVWVANEVTSTDSYVQVPIRVGLNIDYQIILTEGEVDIYYAGEVVGLDVPSPGWMESVTYDPQGVEKDTFILANLDTVVTGAQLDDLHDAFNEATGTGNIVLETSPALQGAFISGSLSMSGVTEWSIPDITPSWNGSAQVKWQTALGLGSAALIAANAGGSQSLVGWNIDGDLIGLDGEDISGDYTFVDTISFDDITFPEKVYLTSSTSDPSISDIDSGQSTIHRNTSSGNVFLAYNDSGTIKKVQLDL